MNYRILRAGVIFAVAVTFGAIGSLRQATAQETNQPINRTAMQKTSITDYGLLTEDNIRQAFDEIPTTPPTNKKIFSEKFYNVAVARVAKHNGPPELHRDSDRVFFIKNGVALMRVGGNIANSQEISPGEYRGKSDSSYTGYKEVQLKAGSVLSIPRNVAYQIIAEKGDVSFIVVRVN